MTCSNRPGQSCEMMDYKGGQVCQHCGFTPGTTEDVRTYLGLSPLMEEECEPTAESQLDPEPHVEKPVCVAQRVVNLEEVKRKPRESVIDALEMALERARSGDLQGVVILQNLGDAVSFLCGGFYSYTDMLAAAEDWKFTEQVKRNLVCPQCGHDERDG